MMIRTTFFMEQHAGHITYYQNLRRFIDKVDNIAPTWVPVTYKQERSWLNRLPLTDHQRGVLVGRMQTQAGLKTPADVLLFNTQVPAGFVPHMLHTRPYVLATDITPLQYDAMSTHYGHRLDGNRFVRSLKHQINVRLFRQAARVVAWSSWAAQSIASDYGVDPHKIAVIHPGVDTTLWVPPAVREQSGPVRILFVGADFERKGGWLLLEAFRRLPRGCAELHIVTRDEVILAGDGVHVYREMQPNSAELIQLYQSCDIFCMPTLAEAFGIVCTEASACGLPIISTDVGGLRDSVVDGETGYLVPPGNIDKLTERLTELVQQPERRVRLGKSARQRAIEQFDASQNAKRVVRILEQIVSEVPAPQNKISFSFKVF